MSVLIKRIYNAKIPILIVLTIIFTFALSIFMLSRQFNKFKEESVYYYNTIIKESIDRKIEISENSEELFDKKAYSLMNSISSELGNLSIENIDDELLKLISKKYDVTGLCILKDDGKFATIETSTVPGEQGMTTEEWGFWNTAIVELFNGESVSVDKGFSIENFWIGPKTYSYVEKEASGESSFYKYAYIKNPGQDYMVSAIVSEQNYIVEESDLNDLLSRYESDIDFIDSVYIVDLSRLKNTATDKEPFIVFGSDRLKLFPLVSQEIKHSGNDLTGTHSIRSDGKIYDFILNKISDDYYIVTIMSGNNNFGGILSTLGILIFIFSLSIYLVSVLIKKHTMQFQKLLNLESKRSEVALDLSKVLSSIPDYVFKCRLDGEELMLVFNEGNAIEPGSYLPFGSSPVPISDYYPEEFVSSLKEQILLGFKGIRSQFEFKLSDKIYSFSTSPVYSGPSEVSEVMVTEIDVSSYIEEREKSRYMACHDSLTMLPNRHMLMQDMQDIISKKTQAMVYFLDLDGFKSVNDTLGHKRGDALLKDVGNSLLSSLDHNMKLFRFGGDEFIILDSELRDPDQLIDLSRRFKDAVSSLESQFEESVKLGVSIGIALYPEDGESIESLLSKADRAMYESKKHKSRLYTITI